MFWTVGSLELDLELLDMVSQNVEKLFLIFKLDHWVRKRVVLFEPKF